MMRMADPGYLLSIYLHLAQASQRRRRPHVRDRLLVLVAAIAATVGLARLADYCRHLILEHNPHHLVGRWPTVLEAMETEDFHAYLRQVQRRYPQEKAERMLDSLGIELGRERESYYSDYEYAAALLGTTPDEIDAQLDQ
jgi:hypothetical protein